MMGDTARSGYGDLRLMLALSIVERKSNMLSGRS